MKRAFLLFVLLNWIHQVQAQELAGAYQAIFDTSNSYISYHLTLRPDGRFEFRFYRKNNCQNCVEENQYGQGSWKGKGKKVLLTAEASDLDEQFTLDLNGSKAHFIFKSPRDRSDRVVATRLKFYDSQLFWVKGLEVVKK